MGVQAEGHLVQAGKPQAMTSFLTILEAAGGLPSDQDGKTLVTLLSETAGDSALLLTQIEQRQSSVTVSIENQSFSGVFNWLRLLSIKHDVIIGQATMTYFDSDRVNARIELNFTQ